MGLLEDWKLDGSAGREAVLEQLFDARKKLMNRLNVADPQKRTAAEIQMEVINSIQNAMDKADKKFRDFQLLLNSYAFVADSGRFRDVENLLENAAGDGKSAFDMAIYCRKNKRGDLAQKWMFWAADCGEARAYQQCGYYMMDDEEPGKAIEYYKKAEAAGILDLWAIRDWGIAYKDKKMYKEALAKFEQASARGDVEAESYIGELYENGYGVDKNLEKALAHYKQAAQGGNKYAKEAVARIEELLRKQTQSEQDAKQANEAKQATEKSSQQQTDKGKTRKRGFWKTIELCFMIYFVIWCAFTALNIANARMGVTKFSSFRYEMVEGGIAIKEFVGSETEVVVPSNICLIPVVEIEAIAFSGNEDIVSVTFPDSIKEIGDYAFSGCSSLSDMNLPSGLERIGDGAFEETGLYSVVIPSSVSVIEWSAFAGCTSLSSVALSEGLGVIGNEAFRDCSSLTFIEIPSSVWRMGEGTFKNCSSLSSVILSENLEEGIGNETFRDCSSLISIEIPSSVRTIGSGAFEGCSLLSSVVLSEGVENIGDDAFSGCSSLTSIEIPASVNNIGDGAFADCELLQTFSWKVSSGLTLRIGSKENAAFENCPALTDVYLPESMGEIYGDLFTNCPSARLRAPKGSFVEQYAKERGIPFEAAE